MMLRSSEMSIINDELELRMTAITFYRRLLELNDGEAMEGEAIEFHSPLKYKHKDCSVCRHWVESPFKDETKGKGLCWYGGRFDDSEPIEDCDEFHEVEP